MDALRGPIFWALGLVACGVAFLIAAVAAQELGRLLLRRRLSRRASGLAGLAGLACAAAALALALHWGAAQLRP